MRRTATLDGYRLTASPLDDARTFLSIVTLTLGMSPIRGVPSMQPSALRSSR